ncbi:puromycin-sensitive aminopeptidase, partial [Pancytospora epiphaga]
NLVTMEWWSDLWLNEGFATWAATLALADSKPLQGLMRWDAWTAFINDDMESGMAMDSIKSTHKIAAEVFKPVEVDQIFDAISYSKGSSIIKMLENWLGNEEFRKGLVHYLSEKKYKNAVTEDLWTALSNSYNKGKDKSEMVNVSRVIDPWIKRKGFPIVDVKDEGKTLTLTQQRFTIGFEEEAEPWPIPIKIRWGNGKVSDFIMEDKSFTIEKFSDYYKLNDEVSGFYRVNYSSLDSLFGQGSPVLSTANRINVFSDAFAIALALKGPLPIKYVDMM